MDLEVLNLKANSSEVDKATESTEKLDKSLSRVDKTIDKVENSLKVMRGQLIEAADGSVKLSEGMTRSQSNMLAMMRQAGATGSQLKQLNNLFEQYNKISGVNKFDKSVQALSFIKQQREELSKSIKYAEQFNFLTKEQISLLSRGVEAVKQKGRAQRLSLEEGTKATNEFITSFVQEAKAYNDSIRAIEEKNKAHKEELLVQRQLATARAEANAASMRGWAGGVGKQSQELKEMAAYYEQLGREADQSAKIRVSAEKYVQEELQRTLFINKQLESGLGQGAANAMYKYKQQLDMIGLSADQVATKMQQFQNALAQNQTLRADRSPFKKMSEDIQETNMQVNQLARAVSVQLGDVFVSLASGQNPLLVAIQQGDQIRFALEQAKAAGQGLDNVMRGAFASMANSFVLVGTIVKDFLIDGIMSAGKMITNFNTSVLDAIGRMVGLGNAATNAIKAFEDGAAAGNKFSAVMVGVINASRILAGGLLLGIVAAIGTFAVASVKLSNDLDKLAVALNTTGASLGLTAQQAQQAAEKIGESYGTNIYDALDAVTLFATKNIQFTDEMIVSATELSRVTGKSLSDIIDSYSSLKGKPVEGLLEVAIATGQVNVETIKTIDKLVEQGKTAEATKLAMQEKARAEQEAARNTLAEMTPLGRLWVQMKQDVSELGEAVYDLVTKSVLVDVFAVAWKGVASVFHVIAWAVKGAGKLIGGIAAQLVALANLDFSGVMSIGNSMMSDAASGYRELEGTLKSLWTSTDELTRKELEAAAARKQANSAAAAEFKKEYEARKKGANDAEREAAKTQKYFEKLMEGASDLALKTQQEVSKLNSGYEQMTNSQKMLFDAQNDPRWNSLSERQKAEFENALKLIAINEELIRQYNAQVALQELLSKWVDDYDSAAVSIKEEVAALELRNNLLFKTEDEAKAIQRQYDLNVKLAAVENKYIERRNKMMMDYVKLVQEGNWSPAALEEHQRNMAAVAQQEAAERELAHKDANLKIVEDYEKRFREIQETVTDIIATALFEGGKSGSKKLKDVLEAEFRNYVIDVFINPIVGSMMGSITNGASSSGGVTGLISNAGSAYNLATGSTVAGISGAVQGAGAFLGSSAVSSFGAGMTMTGTQVAALSEAGLIASKGAASLGSTLGAAMPWVAGGLLVADLLGAFDKKPSDKTSWAVIDPTTGRLGEVGDMGGKKTASQEQKDANVQFSQLIAGFASLTGITGELVTVMGARDGIRLAIDGGFNTPQGSAARGVWLGDETAYNYGPDPATAAVKMMEDLLDEGTLSQSVIDSWNALKTTTEGVTKDAVELVSNLNLLVAGYDEQSIKRADLLQLENEALETAYARMLQYEKAIADTALPGDALADAVKSLFSSFTRLNVEVPTSNKAFSDLIGSLDLTTSSGQATYTSLMNLIPAFLELQSAQEELYNQLLTDEQRVELLAADLSKAFNQLGVAMPKSNEELRGMIDAIDATTQSGAALKAQLLGLVPSFIETISSVNEAQEQAKENAMKAVDAAYQALEKAVDAEKKTVDGRIKSLTDNLTRLKGVFDFLKNAIDGLLRSTSSTNTMQVAQANALIKSVVVSGIIPDDKSLEDAVGVAVEGVEKGIYASRADQERATILLANDLSKINAGVKNQISDTEKLISTQEKELKRLEDILVNARQQIDVLNGINTSVLSVKDALTNFQNSIAAATKAPVTPSVTSQVSGGGGSSGAVSSSDTLMSDVISYGQQHGGSAYYFVPGINDADAKLASAERIGAITGMTTEQAMIHVTGKSYEEWKSIENDFYAGNAPKAYATGGVFTNGIVSSPTLFNMGLMGEAGSEAIMPLTNIGGSLGVRAVMSDMEGVVEELQALRGETAMLRAEVRAVASNTSKSAKLLDRAMPDGQSILVTTAA